MSRRGRFDLLSVALLVLIILLLLFLLKSLGGSG